MAPAPLPSPLPAARLPARMSIRSSSCTARSPRWWRWSVYGVYHAHHAAVPHMLGRGWGRTVTITSSARRGTRNVSPYAPSKGRCTGAGAGAHRDGGAALPPRVPGRSRGPARPLRRRQRARRDYRDTVLRAKRRGGQSAGCTRQSPIRVSWCGDAAARPCERCPPRRTR